MGALIIMLAVLFFVPFAETVTLLHKSEKDKMVAVLLTIICFGVALPAILYATVTFAGILGFESASIVAIPLPIAFLLAYSARKGYMTQKRRVFISMITAIIPLRLLVFASAVTDEVFTSVFEMAAYYIIFVLVIYAATKYKRWIFVYIISIFATTVWLAIIIISQSPDIESEYLNSQWNMGVIPAIGALIWVTYVTYAFILFIKEKTVEIEEQEAESVSNSEAS